MTLTISELRNRVAARFPDAEQIGDSIVRFTRRSGDAPFAVYYIDIAETLPGTRDTLTKYQDRFVGSQYFDGRKSLQWSNYLYFVTSADRLSNSDVIVAKDLIERDRSYARKFVIAEEELDAVLTPPVVAAASAGPRTNVLSVWIECLVEAGLDSAILSEADLPTRLGLIETSSTKSPNTERVRRHRDAVKAEPFIRSLSLKKFRDFPLQRHFQFGTVNLIFGANGSGKTSLLEAIELFYCGRTKRNATTPNSYELTATLADGRIEKANDSRNLQVFRDRNLAWYGQAEVRTNNLCQSFAQFNFLDTDAAVSLSESTSRLEEDLSKLLVGPDASKTWRDIERVHEAVLARLRDLRPLEKQIREELAELVKRLGGSAEKTQESDAIYSRLEEMIRRAGWRIALSDKEEFAAFLISRLSEFVPLMHQAAALNWTKSPVSRDGLTNFCQQAAAACKKAETDFSRLDILRRNLSRAADKDKRSKAGLDLLSQLMRFIDADFPMRIADLRKQQSSVAKYSGWLAGMHTAAFDDFLKAGDIDASLASYHEALVSKRTTAEGLLAGSQKEYSNFTKLRERSVSLAQELRALAARILLDSPKPDECPLCHSQFSPGELARHMNAGIDEHIEVLSQSLIGQVKQRESTVRDLATHVLASDLLNRFCDKAGIGPDISVRSALGEVDKTRRDLVEARDQLDRLTKEVLALRSQGLSTEKFEEIPLQLKALGYTLPKPSREELDQLIANIKGDLAVSSENVDAEAVQATALQRTIEVTLGRTESDVQDLNGALSKLREQLVATESIAVKLDHFASSFPWPKERPITELAVEAESIRQVAVELRATITKERQVKVVHAESTKRKDQLVQQLEKLEPRIKRFDDAKSVFETLQRDHSLTDAMKAALSENRAAIEGIFTRIHSPAEFRGLGSGVATLVRKTNGLEATLKEISTGQRAAFALSIFLAQNAQLTGAPPVVLIDDPIAHVDDLNSLSFLDYLREVALAERRQIFFATASDKVATLFERKFDFLGTDGFRRINLTRDIEPSRILN